MSRHFRGPSPPSSSSLVSRSSPVTSGGSAKSFFQDTRVIVCATVATAIAVYFGYRFYMAKCEEEQMKKRNEAREQAKLAQERQRRMAEYAAMQRQMTEAEEKNKQQQSQPAEEEGESEEESYEDPNDQINNAMDRDHLWDEEGGEEEQQSDE